MATELGKAYVQIIPSAEGISGSISSVIEPEAKKAGESAGLNITGGITSALKGATTAIAAGVTAVTTGIVKGTSDLASYGDNIDKMSQKMGLTASAYQEWDAVMQHSGTSMEAMKASMKTLANAAQTNSEAFELLGISQEELATLSQQELFEKTISALQNVENETERTYLAGKTLGRGATELGALLNTSAEDTQAMRDRVKELGGVMSDDAVKAAALFQDNMQDLTTAVSGLGRGMMSELLPGMNSILAGLTSLIVGEEDATQKLEEGFSSLFTSFDSIADNFINIFKDFAPLIINSIGDILPQIIQATTQLIIALADAIVENLPMLLTTVVPVLIESAIQIVIALAGALISAGPELINAAFELFNIFKNSFDVTSLISKGNEMIDSVVTGIRNFLPEMTKTAKTIIQNLASGIMANLPAIVAGGVDLLISLVNGILSTLPELIKSAVEIIDTLIKTIAENLPLIVEQGFILLTSLIKGILDNLPLLINAIISLIYSIIQTIVSNLPLILQQGANMIRNIVSGIVSMIPTVLQSIISLIQQVVQKFTSFDWGSIGRNLIQGIANGISSAAGRIADAARNAAQSAFQAAKEFLGINSPATKGIWLGDMYDEGVALGVKDNVSKVQNAATSMVNDSFGTLQAPTPSYDFMQPVQTAGDTTVNMTINAPEGMDIVALADLVAERINFTVRQKENAYA